MAASSPAVYVQASAPAHAPGAVVEELLDASVSFGSTVAGVASDNLLNLGEVGLGRSYQAAQSVGLGGAFSAGKQTGDAVVDSTAEVAKVGKDFIGTAFLAGKRVLGKTMNAVADVLQEDDRTDLNFEREEVEARKAYLKGLAMESEDVSVQDRLVRSSMELAKAEKQVSEESASPNLSSS